MAFCINCGTQTNGMAKYCQNCGKPIEANKYSENDTNSQIQLDGKLNELPNNKYANISLIFGIIGSIAWFIPIFGLPITIIGLVFGIRGQKTKNHNIAVIGLILSVIGLVASIINFAIGAYQGATGTHWLF